ncbi:hypothetical protein BB561_000107 [Smittium simulii]|uniref:Uncharacterized protein n=1 Tax=Smittium simulii TaxID=133385 RepID=A0A2T9Z0M7_9FUNG|nr:hypothetical protein BB561_000107 [Smittium simulii]
MGIADYDSSQLELLSTDCSLNLENKDRVDRFDPNSSDRISSYTQAILDQLNKSSEVNQKENFFKLPQNAIFDNTDPLVIQERLSTSLKSAKQLFKLSCTSLSKPDNSKVKSFKKKQKKYYATSKIYPMRKRTDIALHPFTKFQWTRFEDIPFQKRSEIDISVLNEPLPTTKDSFSYLKSKKKEKLNNFNYNPSSTSQDYDLLGGLSLSSGNNSHTSKKSSTKRYNLHNKIYNSIPFKKRDFIIDVTANKNSTKTKSGLIDKKLDEWLYSINKDISSSDYLDENNELSLPQSSVYPNNQKLFSKSSINFNIQGSESLSTNTDNSSINKTQRRNRRLKIIRSVSSISNQSSILDFTKNKSKNIKNSRITVNNIKGVLPASFLRQINKDQTLPTIKHTQRYKKAEYLPISERNSSSSYSGSSVVKSFKKKQKKYYATSKIYPMRKRTDIALHPFTKFQWTRFEDIPFQKRSEIDISVLNEPLPTTKDSFSYLKSKKKEKLNNFNYNPSSTSQDYDLLGGLSLSSGNNSHTSKKSSTKRYNLHNKIYNSIPFKKRDFIIDVTANKNSTKTKSGLIDKKLDEWLYSINKDISSSDYLDENNELSLPQSSVYPNNQKLFSKSSINFNIQGSESLSTNTDNSSINKTHRRNRRLKIIRSVSSISNQSSILDFTKNKSKNIKNSRITVNNIKGVLPASFLRQINKDQTLPTIKHTQSAHNKIRYMGQITFSDIYDWQFHNVYQKNLIPQFLRIANREIKRKHYFYPNTMLVYDNPDIKRFSFDNDPIFSNLKRLENSRKNKKKAIPLKKSTIISFEKNNDCADEVLEVWKTKMLDVRRVCFSKINYASKSVSSYAFSESSKSSLNALSVKSSQSSILYSNKHKYQVNKRAVPPIRNKSSLNSAKLSYSKNKTKRPNKNFIKNQSLSAILPTSKKAKLSNTLFKKNPNKQRRLDWKPSTKADYNNNNIFKTTNYSILNKPSEIYQTRLNTIITKIVEKSNLQKQKIRANGTLNHTESHHNVYDFKINEISNTISLFNAGIYFKSSHLLYSDEPISFMCFLAAWSYSDDLDILLNMFPILKPYHYSQKMFISIKDVKDSSDDNADINTLYNTFLEWADYNRYVTIDTCRLINKIIYYLLLLSFKNRKSDETTNEFIFIMSKIVTFLESLSIESTSTIYEELTLFKWHSIVLLCTIKCISLKYIISTFNNSNIGPLPITVAIGSSKTSFEDSIINLDYRNTNLLSRKIQEDTEFLLKNVNIYNLNQAKKQESGSGFDPDINTEFLSVLVAWFGTGNGFSSFLYSEKIAKIFMTKMTSSSFDTVQFIKAEYRKVILENDNFNLQYKKYINFAQSKRINNMSLKDRFYNINIWNLLNESIFSYENFTKSNTIFDYNEGSKDLYSEFEKKLIFLENNIAKSCDILLALTQFSVNGISSHSMNSSNFFLIIENFTEFLDKILSETIKSDSKNLNILLRWVSSFTQIVHKLVCCEYSIRIPPSSKLITIYKKIFDRISTLDKKQNYSLMKLLNDDKQLFCCKNNNGANVQWGILQVFATLFIKWNNFINMSHSEPGILNKFKKDYKSLISKLLPTGEYRNTSILEYNKLSSDYSLSLTILIGTNDQIISPQRLVIQILGLAEKMMINVSISIDYEFWKLVISAWSILSKELFKLLDNIDYDLLDTKSDTHNLLKKASSIYDSYALFDQSSNVTFKPSKARVLGSIYLMLCSKCFLSLSSGYDLWPQKSHKRSTWLLHLIIKIKDDILDQDLTDNTKKNKGVIEKNINEIKNYSSDSEFLEFSIDSDNLEDIIDATDSAERILEQSKRIESIQKKINSVLSECWIPNIRSALIGQCASAEKDYGMLIKRVEILALTVGDCVLSGLRSWDSFVYMYGSDSLDIIQNCFMRRLTKVLFLQFAITKMSIEDLFRLKYELTECWFEYLVDINLQSYLVNFSQAIKSVIEGKNNKKKIVGDTFPFTLIIDPFSVKYSDNIFTNEEDSQNEKTDKNLSIDIAFGINKFDYKLLEATFNRLKCCKAEAKKYHNIEMNQDKHGRNNKLEYCERLTNTMLNSLEEFKQAKQQTFPANLSVSDFKKIELKINELMKIMTIS